MLKPLQSVFASAAIAVGLTVSGASYANDAAQEKKGDITATTEQVQTEAGKKFVPFIKSTVLTDGRVTVNTESASILNMKGFIGSGKTDAVATPAAKPVNETATDATITVAP